MSSRNSKCALIWWVECKQIDIIPSVQLPKNHEGVGSVVKLMWKDSVNKKSERFEAKILALGGSEEEMKQIIVDSDGKICPFGAEIPANKRKRSSDEEQKGKMKFRKKLMTEPKEKANPEADSDLPLLNLNPSTSTSILTLPKSRINSHSAINNDTMNSNFLSGSSSEKDIANVRDPYGILEKVTLRDSDHMQLFICFMEEQFSLQQKYNV